MTIVFAGFLIVKVVNHLRPDEDKIGEDCEKACPFCQTDIPLAATRCPHGTSQLEVA